MTPIYILIWLGGAALLATVVIGVPLLVGWRRKRKGCKLATYKVGVSCYNCGASFPAKIPCGTRALGYLAKCPRCGVNNRLVE